MAIDIVSENKWNKHVANTAIVFTHHFLERLVLRANGKFDGDQFFSRLPTMVKKGKNCQDIKLATNVGRHYVVFKYDSKDEAIIFMSVLPTNEACADRTVVKF